MQMALQDAGIKPSDVQYINAHGTSTDLNDKYETQAIKTVFGDHAYKMAISSTKSMTGHLLGAAGGVEAAYTTLTLYNQLMPPTINYEFPDPDCDLTMFPIWPARQKSRWRFPTRLALGEPTGLLSSRDGPGIRRRAGQSRQSLSAAISRQISGSKSTLFFQ